MTPHDFNLDHPTGSARDVRIAAAEILAVLWTPAYARNATEESVRDVAVAIRRGLAIVILRMDDAPPIPVDRFPPGTRVVRMPSDPAEGAAVLRRIECDGWESLPLLADEGR